MGPLLNGHANCFADFVSDRTARKHEDKEPAEEKEKKEDETRPFV